MVIASLDRKTIRQSIGYNIGGVLVLSASTNGTSTTLIDTVGLAKGGTGQYSGYHLQMNAGTNNTGLKRWVTAFDATSKQITFAALTDATAGAEVYELWKPPFDIDHVNALISQAERIATSVTYIDKSDQTVFTEATRYLYNIPSGFVALSSVDFVRSVQSEVTIHDCDVVWSELVDADVTASIDTTVARGGASSLKLVVAAGAGAGDILATQAIASTDLTGSTVVEISIYSSVALAAGDLQLLLDNTAQCASPVESLDIPATSANTGTRHSITLANPQSDGAIISVGLKMVVDKGAFTLYTRKIHAVDANSRVFETLNPRWWDIVKGSTDYLQLTNAGLSADCLLRLNGYRALTAMAADTSISEVDPAAIVDWVSDTLRLETSNGLNSQALMSARAALDARLRGVVSSSLAPGTRFI